MKKSFIFIVFLLSFSLVNAECVTNVEDVEDWETVDWSCISEEQIDDVPVEYLDYDSLSAEQRLRMSSTQITVNLDKINDLVNDVSEQRAISAIQNEYGIIIPDLGLNASFSEGVLSSTSGDMGWVSLEGLPSNTIVNIDYDGEFVLSNVNIMPEEGNYKFSSQYDEKEITLPNGENVTFKGSLINNEGMYFMPRYESLRMNGVEFDSRQKQFVVSLEGEKLADDYIAFDLEENKISFGAAEGRDSLTVSFEQGNEFFNFTSDDLLAVRVDSNTDVEIEIVNGQPVFTTRQDSSGSFELSNGMLRYGVRNASIFSFGLSDQRPNVTGSAFTLNLLDEKGNTILGDSQKIIFCSGKQFAMVKSDSLVADCESTSSDVSFNYIGEELISAEKDFFLVTSQGPETFAEIYDSFDELPPRMKNSLDSLKIVADDSLSEECGSTRAVACAKSYAGAVTLGEDFEKRYFRHEVGHTYTFDVNVQDRVAAEKDLQEYRLEMKKKYKAGTPVVYFFKDGEKITPSEDYSDVTLSWSITDQDTELTEEERDKLIDLHIQTELNKQNSFQNRWEEIAGNVYGKNLKKYKDGLSIRWKDGTYGPRNGCIRAYGCNEFGEDVATFFEPLANKDYSAYEDLLSPDSKKYDSRYREKFELGYEYGFVSDQEYLAVMVMLELTTSE